MISGASTVARPSSSSAASSRAVSDSSASATLCRGQTTVRPLPEILASIDDTLPVFRTLFGGACVPGRGTLYLKDLFAVRAPTDNYQDRHAYFPTKIWKLRTMLG